MNLRLPLVVTALVVLAGIVFAGLAWSRRAPPAPDAERPRPVFSLDACDGRTISEKDLRGRVALVYFGYTTCPDVCPTELGWMMRVLRALGHAGEQVQPVFVSVDPARDTAEDLGAYAELFSPRLLALRGDAAAVASAASAFGVVYQRNDPVSRQPGFYLIDHTLTTAVLDREGRIVMRLSSHEIAPQTAAALLRPLIGNP